MAGSCRRGAVVAGERHEGVVRIAGIDGDPADEPSGRPSGVDPRKSDAGVVRQIGVLDRKSVV